MTILSAVGGFYTSATLLDGTPGDPGVVNDFKTVTWDLVDVIGDTSTNLAADTVDTTTRRTARKGFKSQIPTLSDGTISAQALWDDEDVFFRRILLASFAKTKLPILDLSQAKDVNKSKGIVGNYYVTIDLNKAVTDAQRVAVNFILADYVDVVEVVAGDLELLA